MALLGLLAAVGPELGLELVAAHFDHGVRPGSGEEAERVAGWARRRGVSCRVGRPDEPLERSQAAFRKARYRFLRRVADREGADRIATAHQADDQAETVLFRILRGTGLRGLAGIPARRGRLVRPLLPFGRTELEAWVEAEGIPFLRDPSNRDPRWARTRIRHELLPALERAAGEPVGPRLTALADVAGRADEALGAAARDLLRDALLERPGAADPARAVGRRRADGPPVAPDAGRPARDAGRGAPEAEAGRRTVQVEPPRFAVSRGTLVGRHRELRARALRLLARRLGVRLRRGGTRVGVQFIKRGRSGTGVALGDGVRLWREFDVLWVGEPPVHEPDETLEIPVESGVSTVTIGGRPLRVRWEVGSPGAVRETETAAGTGGETGTAGGPGRETAGEAGRGRGDGDAEEAGPPRWTVTLRLPEDAFPLTLRGPRPGDRIRLDGGTRKLKKVLGDGRVPASDRPRRPVLVDAEDRVVWVAGLATAVEDGVPGIEVRVRIATAGD